jgi:Endonuclease V
MNQAAHDQTLQDHGERAGSATYATADLHGEVIGMALRSKTGTRPLFISVGHMIDLATAVLLVIQCLRGYRLPEPTRLADKLSKLRGWPPGAQQSQREGDQQQKQDDANDDQQSDQDGR